MVNKKLKTELSRDDMQAMLELYNTLDQGIDNIVECLDVDLSTLREFREKVHSLREMFNFRAPMDDDGRPMHWRESVLPDAPNAWFYEDLDTPKLCECDD